MAPQWAFIPWPAFAALPLDFCIRCSRPGRFMTVPRHKTRSRSIQRDDGNFRCQRECWGQFLAAPCLPAAHGLQGRFHCSRRQPSRYAEHSCCSDRMRLRREGKFRLARR